MALACLLGLDPRLLGAGCDSRIARHTCSGLAGIATSATPSGASASRIAFITVGVAATVPPSPTPLMPSGLDKLGTGLKSTAIAGKLSARGMP